MIAAAMKIGPANRPGLNPEMFILRSPAGVLVEVVPDRARLVQALDYTIGTVIYPRILL
jgi:hypothetical protein